MDAKNSAVVSLRLTINDKLYEKTRVFSYIDNSQRELSVFFSFLSKFLQNVAGKFLQNVAGKFLQNVAI